MTNSAFTDILQELANYSTAVDNGTITHDDFISFQQLEARIIENYQAGHYQHREYKTLINAYYFVKEGFQTVLGLNQ